MSIFKFKYFDIQQAHSAMKVGTDSMVFGSLIDATNKKKALDIGTGTGVLSLMLAQKNPKLLIDALEIEPKAVDEAKSNVENSSYKDQIQVFHQDFLSFETDKKYDLIFSNPPYFIGSQKSNLSDKNLARHTDSLPLDEFVTKVNTLLAENGHFWVIFPEETFEKFKAYCQNVGLFLNQQVLLFGKPQNLTRIIGSFSKHISEISVTELQIREQDGAYTEGYKELTRDFHFVEL